MNFAIDIEALRERAAERVRRVAIPANRLTEPADISQLATLATIHAADREQQVTPDHLAAVCWTDSDIARFLGRRDRLLRWGWPEADAENLAERLVVRDREELDDRVSCADCRHCRPSRCDNYSRAGLNSPDLGRSWVQLLQRCPGFENIHSTENQK